jgi:hypothetical protein
LILDASRVVSSGPETDDFKKWMKQAEKTFGEFYKLGQDEQVDIKKPQNGTESPLIRR